MLTKIKETFIMLESENVRYAVVRSFLEKFDGDIDVLVSPQDLNKAERLFMELGAIKVDKGRFWPHIQYHIMVQNAEGKYGTLIFDIIIESWVKIQSQAYHLFEDVEETLNKRVKDAELGIYFLDPVTRLRYLLLHTDLPLKDASYRENEIKRLIVAIKGSEEKQVVNGTNISVENRHSALEVLERPMVSGSSISLGEVIKAIECNDENKARDLRTALKSGIIGKNRLFHLKVRAREKLAVLYNKYVVRLSGFRRGLVITLIAPDGFGKTTITDLVTKGLNELGIKNESVYLGNRDEDLGKLRGIVKKLKGEADEGKKADQHVQSTGRMTPVKAENDDSVQGTSHMALVKADVQATQKAAPKKQSLPQKLIKLAAKVYHSLRIASISFKLWKKSQRDIIVTDRSIFNIFLPAPVHFEPNSKYKRHKLDEPLLKLLNKTVFSADLVFHLTGDAAKVAARKPEYDAETLEQASKALEDSLRDAGILAEAMDTTENTPDECARRVLEAIFEESRRKLA